MTAEQLIRDAVEKQLTPDLLERVIAKVMREAKLVGSRQLADLWEVPMATARRVIAKAQPVKIGPRTKRISIAQVHEQAEKRRGAKR